MILQNRPDNYLVDTAAAGGVRDETQLRPLSCSLKSHGRVAPTRTLFIGLIILANGHHEKQTLPLSPLPAPKGPCRACVLRPPAVQVASCPFFRLYCRMYIHLRIGEPALSVFCRLLAPPTFTTYQRPSVDAAHRQKTLQTNPRARAATATAARLQGRAYQTEHYYYGRIYYDNTQQQQLQASGQACSSGEPENCCKQ